MPVAVFLQPIFEAGSFKSAAGKKKQQLLQDFESLIMFVMTQLKKIDEGEISPRQQSCILITSLFGG